MNDNSLLIDKYTLSVLHFDDSNEPIKDECGKLEWKSNYFNLTDKNLLNPNGKFGKCIDLRKYVRYNIFYQKRIVSDRKVG